MAAVARRTTRREDGPSALRRGGREGGREGGRRKGKVEKGGGNVKRRDS
jgi:hypothetical protein